ncbi:SDR family oxidoreductase [Candidatus Sulfurimonas marisnigri]|uniref:SDR family oxidoreductase n=1 Tax=Candidatus Sulfurimonas marisnigri TaxID=2740405 RepID=A0A7S7M0M6_9BACT|nr:SDR family oxidoreductase [Candidatus Sulfurimonas marisnigri]QOY54064.1 SDR family oxidoreductase [Candidatus Sulfurimonas marisnigri]
MTLVVGKRSNLSKKILEKCDDCVLISSFEIENNLDYILKYCKSGRVNIVLNNFQISISLNENINFDDYLTKSILNTSRILSFLINNNIIISSLIYTSSSSVYGNNKFCSEDDQVKPMNLQGALKVANEELIKRFCNEYKINYTITRIFNMYGGDDNFSVISKIKSSYLNNEVLNIINNGNAIRDYVHIDDVVKVYKNLLNKRDNIPKVLNIASGSGKRIFDILNVLSKNQIHIDINNIEREEINASISDVSLLNQVVNTDDFTNVIDYLLKELKR